MKMLPANRKITLFTAAAFVLLLFPLFFAHAQTLTSIPGFDGAVTSGDFSGYINALFELAVLIGSILAVIMIAIGGLRYMTTDAVTQKKDSVIQIRFALIGLLMLLGVYVFFNQINPSILDLKVGGEGLQNIQNNTSQQPNQPNKVEPTCIGVCDTAPPPPQATGSEYCMRGTGVMYCYNSKDECDTARGSGGYGMPICNSAPKNLDLQKKVSTKTVRWGEPLPVFAPEDQQQITTGSTDVVTEPAPVDESLGSIETGTFNPPKEQEEKQDEQPAPVESISLGEMEMPLSKPPPAQESETPRFDDAFLIADPEVEAAEARAEQEEVLQPTASESALTSRTSGVGTLPTQRIAYPAPPAAPVSAPQPITEARQKVEAAEAKVDAVTKQTPLQRSLSFACGLGVFCDFQSPEVKQAKAELTAAKEALEQQQAIQSQPTQPVAPTQQRIQSQPRQTTTPTQQRIQSQPMQQQAPAPTQPTSALSAAAGQQIEYCYNPWFGKPRCFSDRETCDAQLWIRSCTEEQVKP